MTKSGLVQPVVVISYKEVPMIADAGWCGWLRACTPSALLLLCAAVADLGAQALPRFEPGPCPFEEGDWLAEEGIDCGTLLVLENRDHLEGRILRLAVAILKTHSDEPRSDPVVFLNGGPGGASVRHARRFSTNPLMRAIRSERDFILWDQRGTGYSDPEFCPDSNARLAQASVAAFHEDDAVADAIRLVAECRERMLADGLDFSAYNSVASARDLADLRRALGYERWNVFGVSYGSRLALIAARDLPDGIRTLILDASSPPDVGLEDYMADDLARSIDLVFRQCKADAACSADFPDLETEFFAAIGELNADPLVIPMADTLRFAAGRLVLNGRTFASGVFRALYSEQLIPLVPHAIRQVRARNTDLVRSLALALAPDPTTESLWLSYSVECYEQAPLLSAGVARAVRARQPRLPPLNDPLFPAVCEAWHGERADTALLRQPITSEIPTLVAVGEFDPVTPPHYSRQIAARLPRSQFVEVRGLGHGTLPFNACTRRLTVAFLDAPERPLDTTCLDELEAVSFITDLEIVPGIGTTVQRLTDGPEPAVMFWIGSTLLLLVSGPIGWSSSAIVRRVRRRPRPPRDGRQLARPLAGLAALGALVFLGGLAKVIADTAALNPFILGFGLPGSARLLLRLPWLVLALTLATIAYAGLSWQRRWWGTAGRVHYTLVAAACVSFALLATWAGVI